MRKITVVILIALPLLVGGIVSYQYLFLNSIIIESSIEKTEEVILPVTCDLNRDINIPANTWVKIEFGREIGEKMIFHALNDSNTTTIDLKNERGWLLSEYTGDRGKFLSLLSTYAYFRSSEDATFHFTIKNKK